MTTNEPQPAAPPWKPRWYRLTPDRLVVGLLAVEGFLVLSEWFGWFAFNGQTWTVLIALAAVGATLLLMLLWYVVALIFRSRFQYRLRSLMLLVVAVAIPCSWVAVEMKQERNQKAAAEEIARLGGGSVESEPTWLGRLLRDDSLVSVTQVKLFGMLSIDAGLAHCEELRQLRSLQVGLGEVSDTGLAHLRGLGQLERLAIVNAQVSNAGLVHLQGLSRLQVLVLYDTSVTDAGLAHLKGLRQLLCVVLYDTKVTDVGLVYLQELRDLQMLALSNTKVTDAGLANLQGLNQLQRLWLNGTKVTDEGVTKLQQALPNCKIER